MATFNQQGQTVQHQNNADTINIGMNTDDLLRALKHLQAEVNKAVEAKALSGESGIKAQTHVNEAVLQAEQASPNKKTLVNHLSSAKQLVTNVDGLAGAMTSAMETIETLFQ